MIMVTTTVREELVLRKTPSPLPIAGKATPTPSGTGYLHNLTREQRRMLYQLWEMVIEYLSKPVSGSDEDNEVGNSPSSSGERPQLTEKKKSKKEQKQRDHHLADLIYQESLASVSNSSLNLYYGNGVVSPNGSETGSRSSGWSVQGHPLSDELWVQAATFDLDIICLKFLRARKWVLSEAFSMLMETMKWRRRYDIRGIVLEGEAAVKPDFLLTTGKTYFWNVDREGRPIVIITGRLHDRNAQTLEQSCLFTVHLMETGRQLFKGSATAAETVTVIMDMGDAPMSSFDLGSIQFMIQCFQNFYPETLGKCLIINAPWIFWGFWRVVKPLLDPVVAAKIEFVEAKDLPKFIDPARLQSKFGGQSNYEYEWIPPAKTNSPLHKLTEEELVTLNGQIEQCIKEFIDITHSINHSYLMLEADDGDIDLLLAPKFVERDRLKQQLTELYSRLDAHLVPTNLYHRMGIIKSDGIVQWPTN